MKLQRGFTLIELIVVIVILGVIAAVAAPRFINLSSDAHRATLEGVQASLKTGESMVLSVAKMPNRLLSSGSNTYVDMNGNGTVEETARQVVSGAARLGAPEPDPTPLSQEQNDIRINLDGTIPLDEIAKVANFDNLATQALGSNALIGFDFDSDGDVSEHDCYIQYNATDKFSIVDSGC